MLLYFIVILHVTKPGCGLCRCCLSLLLGLQANWLYSYALRAYACVVIVLPWRWLWTQCIKQCLLVGLKPLIVCEAFRLLPL